MSLFIIADIGFLIVSVILAINFFFKNDSSMFYCFVIIAYLIVRQADHSIIIGDK